MYTLKTKRREIPHTRLISAMEQMAELNCTSQIIKEGSVHPYEWEKRKVSALDEDCFIYCKYSKTGKADKGIDEEDFVSLIHEQIEKEAQAA